MGFDPDARELDEYAAQLIRHKARQLVGHYGFTKDDREEIEGDLTLDLLRRLPKYDPTRSARTTFISRIVDHGVATLIERRKAAKRRRFRTCSLQDPIGAGEEQVERGELIDQATYLRSMGQPALPLADQAALRVDLERLRAGLPPELAELWDQMGEGKNMTDIARATGTPRGTLYERLERLRTLAEESGLQSYLEP